MTSGGGGGVRGFARRVEGSGQGGDGKSEKEKEKTKLRERRRRSITGKILEGLRKHGGYELPPRADINDVLRALAREAGWVVEPDGTTYRAKPAVSCQVSPANSLQHSSACVLGVTGRSSTPTPTPTPTSSLGAGGGGHSSATASPLRQPPAGVGHSESASHLVFSGTGAHLPGLGSGLQGGTLASAIHWIHSRMTYDG